MTVTRAGFCADDVETLLDFEPRPRDAVDVPLDAAEKAYYFYGRRDGALEFLHPLFLKLLLAAAGGKVESLGWPEGAGSFRSPAVAPRHLR